MTTPKKQRPTFLQAIAISGAGLLIALFGCLGALSGINSSGTSTIAEAGIAGFVLGILMFIAGGVLLLIVIIRPFFSRQHLPGTADDTSMSSPATPPPPVPEPQGPPEGE